MVVRIVTFGAASVEAARTWARESAHTFQRIPGLEQVLFLHSAVPPQAGAVMVFQSDDALARYKTTGPHERLVESLQQVRADGDTPVREEAYWVMDVIE